MREAFKLLSEKEHELDREKGEVARVDQQLTSLAEEIKEQKRTALEISEKLYLTCSYNVFKNAKAAAEGYDKNLIELKSNHELFIRSVEHLKDRREYLEDLDLDIVLNYENEQLDVDVDVGVLFDELSEITQDQIMQAIDEAYLKFDSYIDDNFRV